MSKILNQVRGFWISMPTFWTNSFGCKAPLMLVEVQRCATSFLGASFFSPLRKPVSFFFSSHSPFETALSSAASHGILFNVRVSMCLRAVDPALCHCWSSQRSHWCPASRRRVPLRCLWLECSAAPFQAAAPANKRNRQRQRHGCLRERHQEEVPLLRPRN